MARMHCAEVKVVQRDYRFRPQPFRQRNHRSVRPSQGEVPVLPHKLSDSRPIVGLRRLNVEWLKSGEEARLRARTESRADQVGDLCDNESREHRMQISSREYPKRR